MPAYCPHCGSHSASSARSSPTWSSAPRSGPIYGFIPEDLIVTLAGPGNPLAIPIAAVIGIPMYIRAETIIPISAVLATKGMGVGAVIALIIGGAGASIPEVTLLASIFQRRLVAAFVVTVLGVAVTTGLVMQLLQNAGLIVFA